MFARAFQSGLFDRLGIGLSGLCLAHCLLSAVLLTVISSASVFLSPAIHEVGLTLAMLLGAIALGKGVREHGYVMPLWVGSLGLGVMAGSLSMPHGQGEVIISILGVLIVALGHDLNRRAVI